MTPAPGKSAARTPNSTTYIATLQRKDDFADLLRGEYNRRFPQPPGVTLFISDGAKWLREIRRTHFPRAVEIPDYYHACEHLVPLLDLGGFGGKERKDTFRKWRRWLKEGKAGRVMEACEALARGADADKAKAWDKALGYYRDNLGRMKYGEYLKKGWFIGSGVVEGACKTLVCMRFKQAGMRWSLKGANALLPFRTAYLSGRYDALWEHMLRQRKLLGAA